MREHRIAAILASALIGAFYWWVVMHAWAMHMVDNPLNQWLLALQFPRNHLALYKVVLYSHDAAFNILLAVPFASMFMLVARLNNWQSISVAVLVANVWAYGGTHWSAAPLLFAHGGFWIGLGMSLLALPAAFLMVRTIPDRWLHERA